MHLHQTVSKFTARWVKEVLPATHPSRVTLRLVASGSRKPTPEEEQAAVELDDPRLSLASAGVSSGCSLLAYVAALPAGAGMARCVAALLTHTLAIPGGLSASRSSHSSPKQKGRSTFGELLASRGVVVDRRLLTRAYLRYEAGIRDAVLTADGALAEELYEATARSCWRLTRSVEL